MDKIKQKFQVAVRCMTYNHSKYITDTMNGFAMQQTTFPFVCMIVDDASTDGEQEVIKQYIEHHFDYNKDGISYNKQTEYAEIIFARHKTNKNCYFAVLLLNENHYSRFFQKIQYLEEWRKNVKYEALCEGDDYWVKSNKLQLQYDALEQHPQCNICFSKVLKTDKYGNTLNVTIPYEGYLETGIVNLLDYIKGEYYLGHWTFHTSSFFYRISFYPEFVDSRKSYLKQFPYGDMPLILFFLLKGSGFFINELAGCYRTFSGGYNSTKKQNPSMAISHEEKLIEALKSFDELTKYEYTKLIERRIIRAEYKILWLGGRRRRDLLSSKYKLCYSSNYMLGRAKILAFVYFPKIYRILKDIFQNH